jgi:hypothetical protein
MKTLTKSERKRENTITFILAIIAAIGIIITLIR